MHGKNFAGIYLYLVTQILGVEAGKELRAAYKENRVKYSNAAIPKRIKKS